MFAIDSDKMLPKFFIIIFIVLLFCFVLTEHRKFYVSEFHWHRIQRHSNRMIFQIMEWKKSMLRILVLKQIVTYSAFDGASIVL